MKKFILSEAQGNELLTYLSKRPYIEVVRLIQTIQALPEQKLDQSQVREDETVAQLMPRSQAKKELKNG